MEIKYTEEELNSIDKSLLIKMFLNLQKMMEQLVLANNNRFGRKTEKMSDTNQICFMEVDGKIVFFNEALKNAIRHTLVPMRLMYSGNAQEYPLTDWREYDDGLSELVVRYYLADGVTETDTDNSGTASAGGAPVKTGTYIVKVAAVEDETQAAVTSLVITAPHEAATEWSTDTENHWHACAAEGCIDHIYDVGTHSFERGICTVCGYADPDYHEHALGTYHKSV